MKKFIAKFRYVLALFILALTVFNIANHTEKVNSAGSVSTFCGPGVRWEIEPI